MDDHLLEVIAVVLLPEDFAVQLLRLAGELVDGFAAAEGPAGELVKSRDPSSRLKELGKDLLLPITTKEWGVIGLPPVGVSTK